MPTPHNPRSGEWLNLTKVDLHWLPRAEYHCQSLGISKFTAETAARYPDHISLDPSMRLIEGRAFTERRRKGDVTVVIGYPNNHPEIWGVYYNLPLEPRRRERSPGGATGSKAPTSMREVRKRVLEAGLVIKTGGRNHDRIETPEGRFVAPLPVSPSDHRWMKNLVSQLARKGYDISRG